MSLGHLLGVELEVVDLWARGRLAIALQVGSTDVGRTGGNRGRRRNRCLSFSPSRRNAIKAALELKLRRAKGVKLQESLFELLSRVHSAGFQGVGTDYSRGDLTCDGLLADPLTVFACYGPVNAGTNATSAAMSTAVAKVSSDFLGALKHWPALKVWTFVHNYVEQPPAQIVAKIYNLREGRTRRR